MSVNNPTFLQRVEFKRAQYHTLRAEKGVSWLHEITSLLIAFGIMLLLFSFAASNLWLVACVWFLLSVLLRYYVNHWLMSWYVAQHWDDTSSKYLDKGENNK